jgi:hypothetical protein
MSNVVKIRQPQTIQILSQPIDSTWLWEPITGVETKRLLDEINLSQSSRETIEREAGAVLSHCVPPDKPSGSETVLVIGYVQSGKTLSFETVSALAHDNGYQIVIVITGTKTNLLEQSAERLKKHLGSTHRSKWVHFENPSSTPKTKRNVENALDRWKDSTLPKEEKRGVLITVLKNHSRLRKLNELLQQLDLSSVPVLIIDDEADQASLNNNVNRGDESTTYSRLTELKKCIPHHSYLQYTATPQAPLLINIIDTLSPRYAEVLTPGEEYTGGKIFFERNLDLIRVIPQSDLPSPNSQLNAPPDSLLEALRIFFLGATASHLLEVAPDNRSMMIHPSQKRDPHHDYEKWVQSIVARWKKTLSKPDVNPDKKDLIEEFQASYKELSKTAIDLPRFPDLMPRLKHRIEDTNIETVNSTNGKTPNVDWQQYYSHILIGGAALDRGFTVEGLIVTYMPRGLGVANADTIQQRARWFGYKSKYLGYCRIYLAANARDVYRSYVDHEEHIRWRLREHKKTGSPLSEWRRAFFLDSSLRPTRNSVLQLAYIRGNYADDWYYPKTPHHSQQTIIENRQLIDTFLRGLNLKKHSQGEHLIDVSVSLEKAYEDLLTPYKVPHQKDSTRYFGLLMQIKDYLERLGDENCGVIWIQRAKGQTTHRTLNNSNQIDQLFQGRSKDGSRISDRDLLKSDGVIIQIHSLNELRDKNDAVVAKDVPIIAVWIPPKMSADWISQEQ